MTFLRIVIRSSFTVGARSFPKTGIQRGSSPGQAFGVMLSGRSLAFQYGALNRPSRETTMRHLGKMSAALALCAAVTLAPAPLAAQQQKSAPQQKAAPAPALPQAAAPKPYKPLAVTLPAVVNDQSFDAFRQEIAKVAQRKDRAALARMVVAKGFFWEREDGKPAPKKSGIDIL